MLDIFGGRLESRAREGIEHPSRKQGVEVFASSVEASLDERANSSEQHPRRTPWPEHAAGSGEFSVFCWILSGFRVWRLFFLQHTALELTCGA